MMKKISLLIITILIPLVVNAEWIVDENDDPFNGKSITVIGSDKLIIIGFSAKTYSFVMRRSEVRFLFPAPLSAY